MRRPVGDRALDGDRASMADLNAEKLAQRAFDFGLLDNRQVEQIRSELGHAKTSAEDFRSLVLRREFLTNFQLDRLVKGERNGYFYGAYKVLYVVGTGTFARVYRAVNTETNKVFAIKVLRKRFREDPSQVELFLREGEVGQMLRHPNIVPIFEASSDPTSPFIVMDFVEGQNLREFARVRKKLPLGDSLRIGADIANGLAYASQKGIYHRDLKLSNVLVTSKGSARLVDFGLYGTRATDETSTETPNARTIDYVGLERATGVRKNDPRSDIFFTGCIIYHLLSGHSPLAETRDRIQRLSVSRYRDIPSLSELEPNLPKAVVAVVNKAMELDADKRYQTPGELLADLQMLLKRLENGTLDAVAVDETSTRSALAQASVSNSALPGAANSDQEGQGKTVMLVESAVEIQNVLREKLKRHGYRVLVLSDPGRALARFEDETPAADCVIFCAGEIGEAAVDAYNKFAAGARTKDLAAILLLGEEQQSWAGLATGGAQRATMKMPIKVRELRETLVKLLAPRS